MLRDSGSTQRSLWMSASWPNLTCSCCLATVELFRFLLPQPTKPRRPLSSALWPPCPLASTIRFGSCRPDRHSWPSYQSSSQVHNGWLEHGPFQLSVFQHPQTKSSSGGEDWRPDRWFLDHTFPTLFAGCFQACSGAFLVTWSTRHQVVINQQLCPSLQPSIQNIQQQIIWYTKITDLRPKSVWYTFEPPYVRTWHLLWPIHG